MAKSLVIVESSAKAKTIERYLGKDFEVLACMGHIRDLPRKDLGIDLDKNFRPSYEVISGSKKIVARLKKKAAAAESVFLAPDPDREGEAIAWHLKEALKLPDEKAFRVTFNEITKTAVRKAFSAPGKISLDKVNAQQDRRILDRLVGYQISPLLWKRFPTFATAGAKGRRPGLSAGRVQSVAVRLIVDREREIEAFDTREFWRITAHLSADGDRFQAELERADGEKLEIPNEIANADILKKLDGADYVVASVEAKETKSNPSPPFTTSTLQQAASTWLRFPAKKTMMLAQQLYQGVGLGEEGQTALITYMRTDSVRMSAEAVSAVRNYIKDNFDKHYLPAKPRSYRSKKGAQEAHEAIRPTYVDHTPESVTPYLTPDQAKLYDLIWRRAVASQMAPARFNVTTVEVAAARYTFVAKGRTILFEGHSVFASGKDEEDTLLPPLAPGHKLDLVELSSQQKFTQPPPRYTEAALVRTLEKEGIGRPSTYATIISTIQKNYVVLEKRTFRPTGVGVFVTDKLVKHFPKILDLKFTRHMETELDEVESGKMDWIAVLDEFYSDFRKNLQAADTRMQSFEQTPQTCPLCSKPLVRRVSRSGLYLACSDYPDCRYTRALSLTGRAISADLEDKKCPLCARPLTLRSGPRGPFVGCTGYPECKYVVQVDDPEGGAAPAEGQKEGEMPEKECPKCGKPLVIRSGKRGDFWGCTGYPECKHTESVEPEAPSAEDADKTPAPERKCPECGKPLVVRSGKRGDFWGCTGYPECKHTESVEAEAPSADEDDKTPPPEKTCPNCGKTLVVKSGRRGKFLACPGYPECKHAEPLAGAAAVKKSPPKEVGRDCPQCGKPLLWRKGQHGKFIGCSGFPKCRYTEAAT